MPSFRENHPLKCNQLTTMHLQLKEWSYSRTAWAAHVVTAFPKTGKLVSLTRGRTKP